jgi:UDP-N-acetylmuramate--alanine ligase
MHIFFSGIGGTGIGPLALVAKQAGHTISGSDKQNSLYISYLRKHGINNIHIGQDYESIAAVHQQEPIDWYVYSSAVGIEQPDAPEFAFCHENGIRMSKRDELLNQIITEKNLQLLAIAGTHGKTTTTAMSVWLARQLELPIGYILPAKSSFAEMGGLDEGAEYFIYECDEFDRNFLHYTPAISIVTGIDWDHPDIYPTQEDYKQAFRDFLRRSTQSILWRSDNETLAGIPGNVDTVLDDNAEQMKTIHLAGEVNRRNAWQVAHAFARITNKTVSELLPMLEAFPGVARRLELIAPKLYSDYAHTPPKIRGALQLGHEVAGDDLVVVYEGLHNTRQHFIKKELTDMFNGVKQLYIVPSYRAREDESLEDLTPEKLRALMSEQAQGHATASLLNEELKLAIQGHLRAGDTVLCLTAGGGGSLDEWLRNTFK